MAGTGYQKKKSASTAKGVVPKGNGKREFLSVADAHVKKQKLINFRMPKDKMIEIRAKTKAMGMRGIQTTFDYLVVTGLCTRNPKVIDFINSKKEEYKKKNADMKASFFGPKESIIRKQPDYQETKIAMYASDFKTLNDTAIDLGLKRQWIFEILFLDAFLKDEPFAVEIIEFGIKNKIQKRKNAVARLSEEKYIIMLEDPLARKILDKLTDEYDNKQNLDPDLSLDTLTFFKKEVTNQQEEKTEEDLELDKELENLQGKRISISKKINKLVDGELDE